MIQETGVYACRKKLGLSQEELAEKLGVTRNTVSRWELGTAKPSMEKLVILSELCGVSLDEVVRGGPVCQEEAPAVPAVQTVPAVMVLSEPVPEAPDKPRRWPLVVLSVGVVCALVIGIIALIGVYSIDRTPDPVDTAAPMEEMNGKEVDVSGRGHIDLEEP